MMMMTGQTCCLCELAIVNIAHIIHIQVVCTGLYIYIYICGRQKLKQQNPFLPWGPWPWPIILASSPDSSNSEVLDNCTASGTYNSTLYNALNGACLEQFDGGRGGCDPTLCPCYAEINP